MNRWVTGDATGLAFPADPDTLREAGAEFLTTAMRRFGRLAHDNHVSRVVGFEECGGGSTGRKALLDVEYHRPQPELHTELFVKFSRDYDNPRRDRGKSQMELEVSFAALSARADLPVSVPVCAFADYHRDSCTGMLLTERIAYGTGAIEPHHEKCLDYTMPDALAHYAALLGSVARLAGAHRAGELPGSVSEQFRFDPAKVGVAASVRLAPAELTERVRLLDDFVQEHPALLPAHLRDREFTDRMLAEVTGIAACEDTVMALLHGADDYVALCHWNANVDNAWFWRNDVGALDCGLLDWGCVSVMNVAMALWGTLCGAETAMWDTHLDDLLDHFVRQYHHSGGPLIDPAELRRQLTLYAVVMGVRWLLDVPANLRIAVPDLRDVPNRCDARIRDNEPARAQLLMLTNFLNLWATRDIGELLTRAR